MHKKFDNQSIEKKWQAQWKESGIYDVGERDNSKEKEYVLAELPYPSGDLHIGHWHAFAVPDIYIRYGRMTGKQMLYPMGFDAFGLPAENAAIKRDINPKEWTEGNIAYMKEQLASMGTAFSWDKSAATTDPEYYKWTQWMFTEFFKKDIAYRGTGKVNWCPKCNTVIANEQVLSDDTCERCGTEVEKKEMPQWMLRITNYADRLVDDLETVTWPEPIKEAQRRWIGRSEGSLLKFKVKSEKLESDVEVFTTRPDTLFGVTYLVLAPEHAFVEKNKDTITNWDETFRYIERSKKTSEQDRLNDTKEKTGVKLEGITATNPANGEEIPVFIADYVLAGYGTGAIMAVPAHDERDFAFATKFGIAIKRVVAKHFEYTGDAKVREEVETLVRDCVDLIIEHPTDGTFLVQKEIEGEYEHIHFVGGGTDGETDKIAIGRELIEETGFTDYEIITGPVTTSTCLAYRHTKNKNQHTKSNFYHIKLTSLNQVPSEIEEGKHTVQWIEKGKVAETINWSGHEDGWNAFVYNTPHAEAGTLINSGEFDGMDSEEAKIAITEKVGGKMTNTYRLRDWSVARQRYWGVPIPIVYDPQGLAHPIPKEHLPWLLPEDVDFRPTGVPPLAKSKELKKRTEEIFGKGWTPEVETLDTFVDSSWYFMRYIDNQNSDMFASIQAQIDWMPIDLYFGGAEHTTMHLLYSRFWQKVLLDMGYVTESEPYKHRINRGLILGPDGNKMSKSKGNVINPDEHVQRVGGDSVKMYLAFMGPYGETANYPWDMGGIAGIRRFLERVYGLSEHIADTESEEVTKQLHKTILKLSKDIPQYKFNTAISAMMVFVNLVEKSSLTTLTYEIFLRMLAPFAPHLTEELWEETGKDTSIHLESFPIADVDRTQDDEVTIGVQVNGKIRGDITLPVDASESVAILSAQGSPATAKWLNGKVKKVIYIPGKILNIIIGD